MTGIKLVLSSIISEKQIRFLWNWVQAEWVFAVLNCTQASGPVVINYQTK